MKHIRSSRRNAHPRGRQFVRTLLAPVVGCTLVIALAACSGGGASSGSDDGAAAESGVARSEAIAPQAPAADAAAEATGAMGLPEGREQAVERELITTGDATLAVADPFDAADKITDLVEEAGGRVETRDEQAADDGDLGSASMTLRIPADRVSATLDALDGLGDVRDRHVETVDVTGTAQDLDARIEALRTSTDRLRELMADADRTSDLIEIEAELATRQEELDARVSERNRLSDEVAMSTLHVEIVAEGTAAAKARPGGFLGGLSAGWSALVSTFNVVVLVLGVVIPWLVLAGLVALLVVGVRRQVARSRTDEPTSTTTPPAPEPEPAES